MCRYCLAEGNTTPATTRKEGIPACAECARDPGDGLVLGVLGNLEAGPMGSEHMLKGHIPVQLGENLKLTLRVQLYQVKVNPIGQTPAVELLVDSEHPDYEMARRIFTAWRGAYILLLREGQRTYWVACM